MDWIKGPIDWSQPQVTAALIAAAGALFLLSVNVILALLLQWWKVKADHSLAERKFTFDKELAERRLAADRKLAEHKSTLDADLAERKFRYDRELNDHRRRVELAESILSDFFQVADVFRMIRSPLSFVGEGKEIPDGTQINISEYSANDSRNVPFFRIRKNSELLSGLMSKRYRSKALLGQKIDSAFDDIQTALFHVEDSASTLIRMASRGGNMYADHPERVDQCEADIWEGPKEGDRVAALIQRAIETAERVCIPILGQPDTTQDRGPDQ